MSGVRPGSVLGQRIGAGNPFQAVAHRGDWISSRENTLTAVASAIRLGADVVEIDVKTTADDQVVVLHDDTLERLWGDPRSIARCHYAELAQLEGPFEIPTLDAALAMIGGTGTAIMIDMDADRWAGPAWRVVQCAIRDGVLTAPEVIWCGRPSSLQVIRDADPQARIVLSWDERDGDGAMPGEDQVEALGPEAVNPHWPMITTQTLAWAERRGVALCCWTVDAEDEMRRLIALGVHAMITNRIGLLKAVLDD